MPKIPTHLQAAPRHLQLHVHGGHVFPCLIQIFPCQILRGLRPSESEWLRIHPSKLHHIFLVRYLHVEADCIPSVSDYPNIHQSSSKLIKISPFWLLAPATSQNYCQNMFPTHPTNIQKLIHPTINKRR